MISLSRSVTRCLLINPKRNHALSKLANKNEDEKAVILLNQGITRENYIISSNIKNYLERAISEDDKFLTKSTEEQAEVLRGFAQEQIQAERSTIIQITDPNGAPEED